PAQQAQRSGILALPRLKPLDGQERLDRTVNHLASNGAVVILSLLDFATGLILQDHAALQATVAMTAETRQDFNAVQGRHRAALNPSLIEAYAAYQAAVDVH